MKFGIVGVVAFIIDWGLMNILLMTHMHNVLVHTIASFMNQPISAATKKIAISIQRAMSGRCLNTNFMLAR